MAKRPGAQLVLAEHRSRLLEWVATSAPTATHQSPLRMRRMAREILHKTRGVVVSSTMALSTAILAMRESGDFGRDSMEVALLQSVLRYSEQYQVPPMAVMQLIADDDEPDDTKKPD